VWTAVIPLVAIASTSTIILVVILVSKWCPARLVPGSSGRFCDR
jgi:hypothetical protein